MNTVFIFFLTSTLWSICRPLQLKSVITPTNVLKDNVTSTPSSRLVRSTQPRKRIGQTVTNAEESARLQDAGEERG